MVSLIPLRWSVDCRGAGPCSAVGGAHCDGVDDFRDSGRNVGEQGGRDPVGVFGAALQVEAAGEDLVGDDPVVAVHGRETVGGGEQLGGEAAREGAGVGGGADGGEEEGEGGKGGVRA